LKRLITRSVLPLTARFFSPRPGVIGGAEGSGTQSPMVDETLPPETGSPPLILSFVDFHKPKSYSQNQR
jgi:hypothetical protein